MVACRRANSESFEFLGIRLRGLQGTSVLPFLPTPYEGEHREVLFICGRSSNDYLAFPQA